MKRIGTLLVLVVVGILSASLVSALDNTTIEVGGLVRLPLSKTVRSIAINRYLFKNILPEFYPNLGFHTNCAL